MAKDAARVFVTGAVVKAFPLNPRFTLLISRYPFVGQIGYALVSIIARGTMAGPNQPVILHMLDIPFAAESLIGVKMELIDAAFPLLEGIGVKMELIDAAFPLLKGVVATTNVVEACTGVNIAAMVGGFPRKEGMERNDVMSKNVSIYKAQASALEQYAAKELQFV